MLQVFLWTALYGIVFKVFSYVAEWAVSIAMVFYTVSLLIWLYKTKKNKYVFLQKMQKADSSFIAMLFPLILLPICNMILSSGWKIGFYIPLVVSSAICEEILFRGVLLKNFKKYGNLYAIITSSLLFALLHIVNIARTDPFAVVALQMFVAFSSGVFYSCVVFKHKSIIPTVISHCLVNVTAGNGGFSFATKSVAVLVGCSCIYIGYSLIFYLIYKRVCKEG